MSEDQGYRSQPGVVLGVMVLIRMRQMIALCWDIVKVHNRNIL